MSDQKVRVRFAPSPTGGLHLGGVRTVLFNYLFAKKHNGPFVLRIEDTDQNRYVEGAEQYILDCLNWCGLPPDESPVAGGSFAPYRQSERKPLYREYAERLVAQGHAYYAFDTPAELEQKRKDIPNFQYGHAHRYELRNSLALKEHDVDALLDAGTPHVIRIKMPEDEHVSFNDMIRGDVAFDTNLVDDKVLLKADGMPTYHLAVVVDDFLMKITHAFRGEEWLPSAPVHMLLWKYLGWQEHMPQWAHLPLILKPDGHGKLSKRDGARLGFPVYAMSWTDPATGEVTPGFRELGFLPEAFINLLATLGWNDGTDQEIFSLDELIEKFSIERVSKAGAKFDFEKAKWFNAEWIKTANGERLMPKVKEVFATNGLTVEDETKLLQVIDMVKDRVTLLPDFYQQAGYFFETPKQYDLVAVQPKWADAKTEFFKELIGVYNAAPIWEHTKLETAFKSLAEQKQIKVGELMLPFRVMLVGGKFGPHVFDIAAVLGKEETVKRIEAAVTVIINEIRFSQKFWRNEILIPFEEYKETLFNLDTDLKFWRSFLNISITNFRDKNLINRSLYDSIFAVYDLDPFTNHGLLKVSHKSKSYEIDKLDENVNSFFSAIINLNIVKAYNSLEILLLESIRLKFFPTIEGSLKIKKVSDKLTKEVRHFLALRNIDDSTKNNQHLINFLKIRSIEFRHFISSSVRVDKTSTWNDFFKLFSILRHVVVHNGQFLNLDTFNNLNGLAPDIFGSSFLAQANVLLQPIEPQFSNFLVLANDFSLNTIKFIFQENNLDFLELTE